MRALFDAIQAKMALGFVPGDATNGIVASLATEQATVAVVTRNRMLFKSKNRPPGDQAEQSAKRADRAAEKTSNTEIERQQEDQQQAEKKALAKVGLFEVQYCEVQKSMNDSGDESHNREGTGFGGVQDGICQVGEARKNGQADRTSQQRKGIEPANDSGAAKRSNQNAQEQVVLRGLPALVTIRLNHLLATLGFGFEAAEEVMKRTHWADPTAEKPANEESGDEDEQAPEQTVIESATGKSVGKADERIDLEEEFNRGGQVQIVGRAGRRGAKIGAQKQEQEQQQKKDLREGPQPRCGRQFHR